VAIATAKLRGKKTRMRFWGFAALPKSGGGRDMSANEPTGPGSSGLRRMSTPPNNRKSRERLFALKS
jgi:hypothetical protein